MLSVWSIEARDGCPEEQIHSDIYQLPGRLQKHGPNERPAHRQVSVLEEYREDL